MAAGPLPTQEFPVRHWGFVPSGDYRALARLEVMEAFGPWRGLSKDEKAIEAHLDAMADGVGDARHNYVRSFLERN